MRWNQVSTLPLNEVLIKICVSLAADVLHAIHVCRTCRSLYTFGIKPKLLPTPCFSVSDWDWPSSIMLLDLNCSCMINSLFSAPVITTIPHSLFANRLSDFKKRLARTSTSFHETNTTATASVLAYVTLPSWSTILPVVKFVLSRYQCKLLLRYKISLCVEIVRSLMYRNFSCTYPRHRTL